MRYFIELIWPFTFVVLKLEACVVGSILFVWYVSLLVIGFSYDYFELQGRLIERVFPYASLIGAVIGCVLTYCVCRRATR